MTLAELAETLNASPRQIRFLVAEGILPSAQKTGRKADAYSEVHLTTARRYFALHRMGMKPSSIKVLMALDEVVPIFQKHGVEVRVAPTTSAETVDITELTKEIANALKTYFSKE